MASLVNLAEAKKSPNEDIISAMSKMSNILKNRYLNDPDFDIDQIAQTLLGDQCYENPDRLDSIFVINDSMIGIPSVIPKMKSDGTRINGRHVVPLVQIPGEKPYYPFTPDTETYVMSETANLRGGRSISIHRVIPGMMVSFHHYTVKDGYKERDRIDAFSIDYDEFGELSYNRLPEHEAIVTLPEIPSAKSF